MVEVAKIPADEPAREFQQKAPHGRDTSRDSGRPSVRRRWAITAMSSSVALGGGINNPYPFVGVGRGRGGQLVTLEEIKPVGHPV